MYVIRRRQAMTALSAVVHLLLQKTQPVGGEATVTGIVRSARAGGGARVLPLALEVVLQVGLSLELRLQRLQVVCESPGLLPLPALTATSP